METFFKENTDIQEWVDLLIEKLFTVCLLNGHDADSEFFRGRQAAERIASILQSLTDLPEDTLKDGIRQLIEQRLPDPRVIENFPQFYSLMEEMIQLGIPNVKNLEVASNIVNSALFTEVPSSKILLTRGPENMENSSQVYIPGVAVSDNDDSIAINVFAPSIPNFSTLLNESIISIPLEAGSASLESEPASSEIELSPKGEGEGVNLIPTGGEQLARVLKQLYPEEQPRWNVTIDQIAIFIQIDNLVFLISKENSSETENIKNSLEKHDWAVVVCQQEDLAYPRRLERFICQTLRKSVNSKTSSSFLS